MSRKAARAAARAAADAPVGPRPRLEIEIIPSSLHHKSPRETLGRAWWNRTRKQAYAAAGNRCELCGGAGDPPPGGAGSGKNTAEIHSNLKLLFPLFVYKKK